MHFVEPRVSLLCSQEAATGLYPEPLESTGDTMLPSVCGPTNDMFCHKITRERLITF